MRKLPVPFLFLLLICCSQWLQAQDIHFSQFYASPLTLNPAETGNFDGDFRVSAIYRDQWRSVVKAPYGTIAAGFEWPLYIRGERITVGAVFVNDRSGQVNLNVIKILASIGYQKTINTHTIHAGLQIGYVNKSLSDGYVFPDQAIDPNSPGFNFDNPPDNVFDQSIASGDASIGDAASYPDMNIGVAWGKKHSDKFKTTVGLAFFHIIKPKESFTDSGNRLKMRTSFSANGTWDINPKIYLQPNMLFMVHSRAMDFVIGSKAGHPLAENKLKVKAVYGGLFYRDGFQGSPDALIPVVGMMISNFDVGFSYDLNVSTFRRTTRYQGAFEISLIYIAPNTRLEKIQIPCERL